MTNVEHAERARHVYERPALFEYGSLSDMTLAVANNSKLPDGGSMSTQKTG